MLVDIIQMSHALPSQEFGTQVTILWNDVQLFYKLWNYKFTRFLPLPYLVYQVNAFTLETTHSLVSHHENVE